MGLVSSLAKAHAAGGYLLAMSIKGSNTRTISGTGRARDTCYN